MNMRLGFHSFFATVQETKWYQAFLNPIIDRIEKNTSLLDIGTGTGKLLQRLSTEKSIKCTGVDTNQAMLDEARKKVRGQNVSLFKIVPNSPLPF